MRSYIFLYLVLFGFLSFAGNFDVTCTYPNSSQNYSIQAPGSCRELSATGNKNNCKVYCSSVTRFSNFQVSMSGIGALEGKRVWSAVSTKTTTRQQTGKSGPCVVDNKEEKARNNCYSKIQPEGVVEERGMFCPDSTNSKFFTKSQILSGAGASGGPGSNCNNLKPSNICTYSPPIETGNDDIDAQNMINSQNVYNQCVQIAQNNFNNCLNQSASSGDCYCSANSNKFEFINGTWKCTPCPDRMIQDRLAGGTTCKADCPTSSPIWDRETSQCVKSCPTPFQLITPQNICLPACAPNEMINPSTLSCEKKCSDGEIVIPQTGGSYTCLSCPPGKIIDMASKSCVDINLSLHKCGPSGVSDSKNSIPFLKGVSSLNWGTGIANPLLACCLSDPGSGKYHCAETKPQLGQSFDDYYNGVGLNAENTAGINNMSTARRLFLKDSSGQPVVGIYRADGSRCSFETSNVKDILDYLSMAANNSQSSDLTVRQNPLNGLPMSGGDIDRKNCTILVRAALETICNSTSYAPISGDGKRCNYASEVKVHYEVRDLTAGRKKQVILKTVSTIGPNGSVAAPINIKKLLGK